MICKFEWINEPAIWCYENNSLSVITDDHTDFWRRTWYGFERFTGHIYATDVKMILLFRSGFAQTSPHSMTRPEL